MRHYDERFLVNPRGDEVPLRDVELVEGRFLYRLAHKRALNSPEVRAFVQAELGVWGPGGEAEQEMRADGEDMTLWEPWTEETVWEVWTLCRLTFKAPGVERWNELGVLHDQGMWESLQVKDHDLDLDSPWYKDVTVC